MTREIQQLEGFRDSYLRGEISLQDYKDAFNMLTRGVSGTALANIGMLSPDYVSNQKSTALQSNAMQGYGQASGVIDIARQLGLTALVADQIGTSNRGLNTPPPGVPTPPTADPVLQQRLYESIRRAGNVSDVVDPAKQQIENSYLAGLQQAAAGSGGQATNFMAMANLLNQQRAQQGLQLAPIAQQARLQNENVVGDYLGMRMGETQNRFGNQMAANQVLQQRFDAGQKAYGEAGAYGRFNLANIIQNFKLPEYFNWMNFDEETSGIMKKVKERRHALNAVKSLGNSGKGNFNPATDY